MKCLLWKHRSAVACCRDRGSGCSRLGSHSITHHRTGADDPKTAEKLYQRNSHTVKKVLRPTTDFTTQRPTKGLRTTREFDFGGQWGLITDFNRTRTTDFWRAQTKPGGHRNQEKGAVSPQETDSDLPVSVQESLVEACVWSQTKKQGGNTAPHINRKFD